MLSAPSGATATSAEVTVNVVADTFAPKVSRVKASSVVEIRQAVAGQSGQHGAADVVVVQRQAGGGGDVDEAPVASVAVEP